MNLRGYDSWKSDLYYSEDYIMEEGEDLLQELKDERDWYIDNGEQVPKALESLIRRTEKKLGR